MYTGTVKYKPELGMLAAIALFTGVISASSYSIFTTLFAQGSGQGQVLTGDPQEPVHSVAATATAAVDQFALALVLILVAFGIGAYVALNKKKGKSVFPEWKALRKGQ